MWTTIGMIGSALATGLLAFLATRRQNSAAAVHSDAEAARVIQQASMDLLEPLRAQIREANAEVDKLKAKVHDLSAELDRERIARNRAEGLLIRNGIPID